jgi:transposase-like protein
METYPNTMKEFYSKFTNEEACQEYLIQLKWENGFTCPKCSNPRYWKNNRGVLVCTKCEQHISLTAGTLFSHRHLPLSVWFEAMWLTVFQKNGISGLGIARALGLKREKTGWDMLQNIRKGMIRAGREKLSGLVEVDEVFIGGIKKGPRGRGALGKALVLFAVEDKAEKGYGRARMQIIENATSHTLISVIQEMIETGSSIRTDEFTSYVSLPKHGFKHITTAKTSSEAGEDPTALVHRVSSLVKRWLLGTHQGGVRLDNLGPYLNEFIFRFNRRTSKSRGKLFYRLVQGMLQKSGDV